jgi:hypothetical protein
MRVPREPIPGHESLVKNIDLDTRERRATEAVQKEDAADG